jgi:hypothetical protein
VSLEAEREVGHALSLYTMDSMKYIILAPPLPWSASIMETRCETINGGAEK